MKKCKLCENEKPFEEFYKDRSTKDGHTRRCKICSQKTNASGYVKNKAKHQERGKRWHKDNKDSANTRNRENYHKNKESINQNLRKLYHFDEEFRKKSYARSKEWSKNNPKKRNTYNIVACALRNGKLKKNDRCQICGSKSNIECHHHDYDKPLDVIWLCRACHKMAHSKYKLNLSGKSIAH